MNIVIANLKPEYDVNKLGEQADEVQERMDRQQTFPIGLGIIASVLKSNHYDFTVYDSYISGSADHFLQAVSDQKTDIVMMSGFVGNYNYSFSKNICKRIKEVSPDTIVIIGGPMATTMPQPLSANSDLDFIVVGEGENTIIELLDAIRNNGDVGKVKGVFLGRNRGGFFTGNRKRIPILKIWPDYESFAVQKYVDFLEESKRCWEISSSRGCWNRCAFCKITFGKTITSYKPKDIIDHLFEFLKKYSINRFSFVDDNFLNSSKNVKEFVAMLNDLPVQFKWRAQGRADNLSPELLELMMSAGFYDIAFGLESGSQDMLNRYKKNLDLSKATENLLRLRDIIPFRANFIIGGPGENWETIKMTEQLVRKLRLKYATFTYMTLYTATVLYDQAVQDGIIQDEEEYLESLGPTFYNKPYTNISDLSTDDLVKARNHLYGVASEYEDEQ